LEGNCVAEFKFWDLGFVGADEDETVEETEGGFWEIYGSVLRD